METRQPKFLRVLVKEDPPKRKRRTYIRRCINGGVELDKEYRYNHPDVKKNSFMSVIHPKVDKPEDVIDGSRTDYYYVGDCWWCRKKNKRYEFARFHCVTNDENEDLGLWKREYTQEGMKERIVFKEKRKGRIIGWNKDEVKILWDGDDRPKIYRSLADIEFKYVEDFRAFKRFIKR